jgi:hypothetical protein
VNATINGKRYRIEFSYRFGRNGRPIGPGVRGTSSCAIVQDDDLHAVAIGTAVCSLSDQWSRQRGRTKAFLRAVAGCSLLKWQTAEFATWFNERWPVKEAQAKVVKRRLSPEMVERFREDGELIRLERERRRNMTRLVSGAAND